MRRRIFQTRNITRVPRSRVNVALRVGNRLPHRWRAHRFSPALLAIVPAYAAYRYIVIGDEICVVEPDTYEIVDVIPAAIVDESPSPAIILSSSQRGCVLSAVPRNVARADVDFALNVNTIVPEAVALVPLPEPASRCAAALDGYDYFVSNRNVVLVEPDDRRIVLTLQF